MWCDLLLCDKHNNSDQTKYCKGIMTEAEKVNEEEAHEWMNLKL